MHIHYDTPTMQKQGGGTTISFYVYSVSVKWTCVFTIALCAQKTKYVLVMSFIGSISYTWQLSCLVNYGIPPWLIVYFTHEDIWRACSLLFSPHAVQQRKPSRSAKIIGVSVHCVQDEQVYDLRGFLSYLMFGCGLETTSNLEKKREVQFEIIIRRGRVCVEGEGVQLDGCRWGNGEGEEDEGILRREAVKVWQMMKRTVKGSRWGGRKGMN